jgi:hypothetical protein
MTTGGLQGLVYDVTLDAGYLPGAGEAGGRLRYTRANALQRSTGTAEKIEVGAELRIATFKSGDRINSILFSDLNAGATGIFDLGLYLTGTGHDGAVVDLNLYATVFETDAGAETRLEMFSEASLTVFDSGKTIWETLGLGEDPHVMYDLTAVYTEITDAVAAYEQLWEIYYTAGD